MLVSDSARSTTQLAASAVNWSVAPPQPSAPIDRVESAPQEGDAILGKVGHLAKAVFAGHLEARVDETGAIDFVNTTGDVIKPEGMLLKSRATIVQGKDGQPYVFIGTDKDGRRKWLARSEFEESEGPDGILYLPEYGNSKQGAALSGGMLGLASLAPLGPVGMAVGAAVGVVSGVVAQLVPTDKVAVKALVGAGIAAGLLAGFGALVGGGPAAAGLALVGGFLGATGAIGGEGVGRVRDGTYAGTLMGAVVPGAALALPIAAGLGARARSPVVQALVSATLAAGLTAAKIALVGGGGPAGIAVAAAAGAIAPAAGRLTMNMFRNGGQAVRDVLKQPLQKLFKKLPDTALCALAGLPLAFLGGTVAMVGGLPVAIVAAVAMEGVGFVKAKKWLTTLKKNKPKQTLGTETQPSG